LPGAVVTLSWPGNPDVFVADEAGVLGGNMSGLTYEPSGTAAPGVLWASKNGPGTLFRMLWNGTVWVQDPAWLGGKTLRYGDGAGDPMRKASLSPRVAPPQACMSARNETTLPTVPAG
jgi:hypothetical protein